MSVTGEQKYEVARLINDIMVRAFIKITPKGKSHQVIAHALIARGMLEEAMQSRPDLKDAWEEVRKDQVADALGTLKTLNEGENNVNA